jgi:hypothetical protein
MKRSRRRGLFEIPGAADYRVRPEETRKENPMKHKLLFSVGALVVFSVFPCLASAQNVRAMYYGYGDTITLTQNTPVELLEMPLNFGETELVCLIEATGYVNVGSAAAVFKVWLEADGGSNGSSDATDEEITRRFVRSKTGALQSSFHTSMLKTFPCCKSFIVRLMGTNFSGKNSLYVNYHGITVSCYNRGNATVLNP